jgi:hypothetical protein
MTEEKKESSSGGSGCGCGLGSFVALFLSLAINHGHVGWAILHFFMNWLYVVYAVFFRTHDVVKYFQDAAK